MKLGFLSSTSKHRPKRMTVLAQTVGHRLVKVSASKRTIKTLQVEGHSLSLMSTFLYISCFLTKLRSQMSMQVPQLTGSQRHIEDHPALSPTSWMKKLKPQEVKRLMNGHWLLCSRAHTKKKDFLFIVFLILVYCLEQGCPLVHPSIYSIYGYLVSTY